jgi:hypothetical protein
LMETYFLVETFIFGGNYSQWKLHYAQNQVEKKRVGVDCLLRTISKITRVSSTKTK